MTTQTGLGTIQLANALAAGMSAETVAYATLGQAMHKIANESSSQAKNEYQEGSEAAYLAKVLGGVQIATTIVGFLTFGALAGAAAFAEGVGVTASTAVQTLGTITQGVESGLGAAQSGLEAGTSGVKAKTTVISTALDTLGKLADNDSKTIQNESKGAAKIGSDINSMLISAGTIESQKFI